MTTNSFISIKKVLALLLIIIVGVFFVFHTSDKIQYTNLEDSKGEFSFIQNGDRVTSFNKNNNFSIGLSPLGFSLSSTKKFDKYKVSYELEDLEINDKKLAINSSPEFIATSNKMTVVHSDDFSINYTNNNKGLRQDFVINRGPENDVKFAVKIALNTNLTPYQKDQFSIGLKDNENAAIDLEYKDLIVFDADGKFLKSEMVLEEDQNGNYNVNLLASAETVKYPVTIDPLSVSRTGFESGSDSLYTGFAVSSCDLNNDGYSDAVVGSYGYKKGVIDNTGKIDVFYGSAAGIDMSVSDFTIEGGFEINLPGFEGVPTGPQFGYSIDCANNVNGDVYPDLIVGAPATSIIDTTGGGADTLLEVGAFYIFYGSMGGLTLGGADTIYGTQDSMNLGFKVAGIGNVNNNDAFADIAVSAPGANQDTGLVYIYLGSAGGLGSVLDTICGTSSNELFGTALAGPGDIDKDGRDDILIGAHNYINTANGRTDTAAGIAQLYLGNNTSISKTPAWEFVGEHKNANFGFSVSGAGNFDGDANDRIDVIIGSNQYNPNYVTDMPDTIECVSPDTTTFTLYNCYGRGKGIGAVYVFSGTSSALGINPTTIIINDQGESGFGSSVSQTGDMDGDNHADIIVGAPFYSKDTVVDQGAVYGYYSTNFTNTLEETFDWCVLGERRNAYLGVSVSEFGLNDPGTSPLDTASVLLGAYGYNGSLPESLDSVYRGAAFLFKKGNCGLEKFVTPDFLTFPDDTITVDDQAGVCGAIVTFDYPEIGSDCPADVSISTGLDSGDAFPIGFNTVTFVATADGQSVSRSFVIEVTDNVAPMPSVCESAQVITLPTGNDEMPITWDDPIFSDNSTCSGGVVTINQLPGGEMKGNSLPVGIYPVTYEASDESGNLSYCTFRVIISKTSTDGRDCQVQSIPASTTVSQSTESEANIEVGQNLNEYLSLQKGNFGLNILMSLFEGASGLTIPSWVKAALGQAGTGINLVFVEVSFNFLPELLLEFGTYYRIQEATPLDLDVNYAGEVCSIKPVDKNYGCRDTVCFASSFLVDTDPNNTFLNVTPGELNQVFGVYMRNFEFRWRISITVSACIGVPLCVPIVGPCLGCAGYRDSWTEGVDVFNPIKLLEGANAINVDLVSVCDASFEQGAGIATVINCLGLGGGADTFVKELLGWLPVGPDNIPIDPFYYDLPKDEFVFDPNRLPVVGNKIPEMQLRFGRLTNGETQTDPGFPARQLPKEMGPTFVNGTKLVTSGRERSLISATVDIFSLLYYAIPEPKKLSLACAGIDIGTKTINIGKPTITPASGSKPKSCQVDPWNTNLSIDVLDINIILRSEYNVSYSYDPTITVDSMDLGVETAWVRPNAPAGTSPTSGNSRYIFGVGMDENIKIGIPDDQTLPYFIGNKFRANGQFIGNESKTQKIDLGINVIEFAPSRWIPTGLGPLIPLGPFNLLSLGTKKIRSINRNLPLPNFSADVTMTPDDLDPTIVTNPQTVYLNQDGFAYLDAEAAFNRAASFDNPPAPPGTGKLNLIGVFPDTIFCSDYPETTGFLVVEDDNCNFDTSTFVVTVMDTILPQMGCVDIVAGIGAYGIYVINPDEIAIGITDNCRDLVVTADPDTLYCSDVGNPVEVTIRVTDIEGNTNSCTATVTVVDTMALLLECPYLFNYPVTRDNTPGFCYYTSGLTEFQPTLIAPDCETVITYELTGATIGSGMSNVNGVNFNLGETTVTYTATDASGNSTSCSFVVIVEDNENPLITCPANVTISTNEDGADDYNCTTSYTWTHPNPTDNCSIIDYEVTYTFPDGSTEVQDLMPAYNSGMLDETRIMDLGSTVLNYVATDTMGNIVECEYIITVIDDEAPEIFCTELLSSNTYAAVVPVDIKPLDLTTISLEVPTQVEISDVNILSLVGTHPDMQDLSATLTSPSGTVVNLFSNLCGNTTDFDLGLDDSSMDDVSTAPCMPLGQGGVYSPEGSLADYNGQMSQGTWTLTFNNQFVGQCGVLETFELQIIGLDTLGSVNRLQFVTDPETCEYTVGTGEFDPEFIDNCMGANISHNLASAPSSTSLNGAVLPLGETEIVWTVTDGSGNETTCTLVIEVLDNVAPRFTNCPYPIVAQNSEENKCEAYVNFSLPLAVDNCTNIVQVNQIDNTGLTTGSVFPTGQTILTFEALDIAGNTETCVVRVIVNDTQLPSFACPSGGSFPTNFGECSAVVNGLATTDIEDNCVDNITVVYQIEYPIGSGIIVNGGVENANNNIFEKGTSKVTYRLTDQPVLLISEVAQDYDRLNGGTTLPYTIITGDDLIELTNLGPASMDISRLIIERESALGVEPYTVNDGVVLQAGETFVLHYGNGIDDPSTHFYNFICGLDLDSGEPASYSISFEGKVMDAVATNNDPGVGNGIAGVITSADWAGNIGSISYAAGIARKFSYDNNNSTDWVIVNTCEPLTLGMLNPQMEAYASNGSTTALQLVDANEEMCMFEIEVTDPEAPYCVEFEDKTYVGATNLGLANSLSEGACFLSEINVPDMLIVGDLSIVNLQGNHTSIDSLTFSLISPSGTEIVLFDGLCGGSQAFDLNLDSDSIPNVALAPCMPLGQGGYFAPQESLDEFIGEQGMGVWTLQILNYGTGTGQLDNWTLLLNAQDNYSQMDTIIANEFGLCGASFTWEQPRLYDNCINGTIRVEYTTNDDIDVPANGPVDGGTIVTEFFEVGTTLVTYILQDAAGNTEICFFEVTIEDAEDPTIDPLYCRDITISLDAGECEQILFFNDNLSTIGDDNCEIVNINYSPPNGSAFGIGVTTVTLTVTDPAGNTGVCTFNVDIRNYNPTSNDIACNDEINISLNGECEAIITADMILEGGNYYCYEEYCITITNSFGIEVDNLFDQGDVNQSFTVTVTDCLNSGNSCWTTVNIEEKLIPEFNCPKDTIITCHQDIDPTFLGSPELLTCEENINITYSDDVEDFGICSDPRAIIDRLWLIDDFDGNIQNCSQRITIEPANLDDIVWPFDVELADALECELVQMDPSLISVDELGHPTIYGSSVLGNSYCALTTNVSDEIYDLCAGSYEILRTWKVRNMCLPLSADNPRIHTQIIKVLDTTGPLIAPCPDDITVSTDPWNCLANTPLPIPEKIEDACSSIDFSAVVFGGGFLEFNYQFSDLSDLKVDGYNFAPGLHNIIYTFEDECKNITTCRFGVTVIDKTPPIAIAKKDIVLSITGGSGGPGSAALYTDAFDKFSYDNCTDVYLEIRRIDGPECDNIGMNGHNNNNTFDNTNHTDDNINDTDGGQYVKFCCEDINAAVNDVNGNGVLDPGYVMVVLRVWDDGNFSGVYGDEVNGQTDNFSEVWSFVKVEDKLPPILACPDDATIYCDWGIDVSSDFGGGFQNANQANFDKTGLAQAFSTCGAVDVFFNDNLNLDDCGVGTIIRQWQATTSSKTGDKVVTCQQIITVEPRTTQFEITPPNPNPLIVGCTLTQEDLNRRLPTVVGGACDVIGENVKIDTFLFENGVCKRWVAEYNYYNWCTKKEMGPYYAYFLYEDTEDPVMDDCEDKMFNVDGNCQHVLTLTNSATDGGGCTVDGWLKWQLFVDTWADGNVNHYASSFVSSSTYRNWTAVSGNDPVLPQLGANQSWSSVVYVKYVEPTSSIGNDPIEVSITEEVIDGMMSNHKVTWKVTDGCHNHSSCSYDVMVVDKKAPTPYCVSLSTALMVDGWVELWARDFDQGSFDNCSLDGDLLFTFNEMAGAFSDTIITVGNRDYLVNASVPQYFDENGFVDFDGDGVTYPKAKSSTITNYNDGNIQRWRPDFNSSAKVFDCDEYQMQGPNGYSLFMSVHDKKLNTDYCQVFLTMVDNGLSCDANGSRIAGTVTNATNEPVNEVSILLEGNVNDLTRSMTVFGEYNFDFLPLNIDYEISASKNIDFMNGISTKDLVFIQRHILELQKLTTSDQLIAADINNDKKIRASDLVELRKLILGVVAEFPNNSSWKFVNKAAGMSMQIPLVYEESIIIDNLQGEMVDQDLLAIKVGDVTGNAKANLRSIDSEPRVDKQLNFEAIDQLVKPGQVVTLDITSSNYNEIFGYQFTTEFDGLNLVSVKGKAIEMTDEHFGFPKEGVMTASWAPLEMASFNENEVLFTLEFEALAQGKLSEMIRLSSSITNAEAYVGEYMNTADVSLTFRSDAIEEDTYALYQNLPNPFRDITAVNYKMAEDGQVTFTLYDVTGKVLLVKKDNVSKGINSIKFKASELGVSGIVYYQMETEDFTATKKMILID